MTIGYRETTEEAERRFEGRESTIAAIATIAVMIGMDVFSDAISAQLELTRSGFKWLTFAVVVIVAVAVSRFFRHRRASDIQATES